MTDKSMSADEILKQMQALQRQVESMQGKKKPTKKVTPARQKKEEQKQEKKDVDALQPKDKQYTHRLGDPAGFGLRVSPGGTKTFIYEARVNGKNRRIKCGVYGPLTIDEGREKAREFAKQVAQGIDPAEVRSAKKRAGLTLQTAVDEYLQRNLKESTRKDVKRAVEQFKDWLNKPVTDITPVMVEERHKGLSEAKQSSGARANLTMRYLRAILNHASVKHAAPDGTPLLVVNPVQRLGAVKRWNKVKRRRTFLKPHMMPSWWKVVMEGLADLSMGAEMRDCLLFSMLTGARPNEAIGLQWRHVDFKGKTVMFPDTKNHSDHELPMTEFIQAMLKQRHQLCGHHEYVFSNMEGRRLTQITRWAQKRIDNAVGEHVMPTDLRRTFVTTAERLDIGPYTLKRMLNHTIEGNDVTAGYIVPTTDRLRTPMQLIEDQILRDAGVKSGDVVELRAEA
jgi:integrase